MKKVLIFALIVILLVLGTNAGTGSVEIVCQMDNEYIEGTVGEEITTSPYLTLQTSDGLMFDVDSLEIETDVDLWIDNLPVGLSTSFSVNPDGNLLTIYFGGTPTESSDEQVEITIPTGYLLISEELALFESYYPVTPSCVYFDIESKPASLSCNNPVTINTKVGQAVDQEVTFTVENDVLLPTISSFTKDIGNGLTLAYKSSLTDENGIYSVTFSITGTASSTVNETYNLQIDSQYLDSSNQLSNSSCIIKVIEEKSIEKEKEPAIPIVVPPFVLPTTGVE